MKKNKKFFALLAAGAVLSGSLFGCSDMDSSEDFTEASSEQNETIVSSDTNINNTASLPPSDELYQKLEKINNACFRYYSKNKSEKKFYSWAGMLSVVEPDSDEQKEVTSLMLKELGYLNDDNFIEEAFNIYVKPRDIDTEYKKTGLDIFTALETTDGYIVYGEGYGKKLITKENFRELLLSYNPDHGEVVNPASRSELYNAIIIGAASFRKDFAPEKSSLPDYIVRYLACNDLYAVLILSGSDDVTDTTEYLLKKENNTWTVVKNALENEADVKTALNNEYPDFYLGLLPPYTLYEYRKEVRTTEHYQAILDMLKNQKIIDSNDTVTYCCGTQSVLYFEFASGKKLAGGAKKDGTFSCNLVNNYEEAIKELARFGEPVPAFILKYDK